MYFNINYLPNRIFSNIQVRCSKFYSVPSSSPTIRMSCHPNSLDGNSKQCKCAEGGCLKCRYFIHTCSYLEHSGFAPI